MEVGAPSRPSDPEGLFVHKNRLQEFTQRAALPLPSYQTTNEGYQHAPEFRATVVVDGTTFTSSRTHVRRKAAEQDVAKVAFECICEKIKHEGVPLIQEDSTFCKSILHEYAAKVKFEKPTYKTSQAEGLLPMFITSSFFNGETFTGSPGKNKKEAEQLAARTIIKSILANSNTRTMMCEIIESKRKLYAAINKCSSSVNKCSSSVLLCGATLSNGDKLPGNTYPGEMLTTVPATESRLSQAIKIEEYTCGLSSKAVGNVSETHVVQQGPPAAAICSANKSSVESHLDENNRVNDGKQQIPSSLAPGDSPSVVRKRAHRGRKRSKKWKESQDSKKARAIEQLPENVAPDSDGKQGQAGRRLPENVASASTVNLQQEMPVMNDCAPLKIVI